MPATVTRTEQICNMEVWQRFTFVDSYDGDASTEYVKVSPTHYRKAGPQHDQSVCLPIRRLSRAIRTQVRPS